MKVFEVCLYAIGNTRVSKYKTYLWVTHKEAKVQADIRYMVVPQDS